jgi:hypothetical protein
VDGHHSPRSSHTARDPARAAELQHRLRPSGFGPVFAAIAGLSTGLHEVMTEVVYPYVQVGHPFAGREAIEPAFELDKAAAIKK